MMVEVVIARSPKTLTEVLDLVELAQAAVRENGGLAKEEAKEALEACVTEELLPALIDALEDMEDMRDIVAVARFANRRRLR